MHDYKKTKLKNGIRVVTVPSKNTEAATALVLIKTGSHYEDKRIGGVSHYLEHLVFKGSKKYPDAMKISTILDGVGAHYNAFTGEEVTGFYVKVVKDKIELAVDVMGDFLKNPLFVPAEINRERGVILEELHMYYDNPQRHVFDLFTQSLFGDQPAGRDIGGSEETVRNIKRADIIDYFERQYRGNNIVLIFAGNISHAKANKLATRFFGALPSGDAYEKPAILDIGEEGPRILTQVRNSDQTHLILGSKAFDLHDERRYALAVLSTILGGGMSSRLFSQVRERRGLAYYVRAMSDSGTDYGYLLSNAGVANAKLEEALKVIVGELHKLKKILVGKDELLKAKNHIEGSTLLGLETSDAMANYIGIQELLVNEITTPTQQIKKINRITAKDVQDVANDVFLKKEMSLALIGPAQNESRLKLILSKL